MEFLGWDAFLVMVDHVVGAVLQLLLFSLIYFLPCHQKFKKVNACLVVRGSGHLALATPVQSPSGNSLYSEGVAVSINCVFLLHIALVCSFLLAVQIMSWRKGSLLILLVRVGKGASCCSLTTGASGL